MPTAASVPRALTSAALLLVLLLCAAPAARAQVGDIRTPRGYEYCGSKDFGTGRWTYEDPEGAFLLAFARNMTCRSARRNVDRIRYTKTPPYRPFRPGYRCVELEEGYEYTDVRCRKRGARATFRYQTGS